jgi:thioredoxin-dependent peroxiredoxin
MIDPPKATKGRRMSKKTRKKSPKTSSRKPARGPSTVSAKIKHAKSSRAAAVKSGKSATSEASHKAPSKRLRPSKSAARRPASSKASAASLSQRESSVLLEGTTAPAFRLPRDGGSTVSLSDFSGKKLVLFFYPRADTPGCTKEAIDFTRLKSAFAESQTEILGISADPLRAQEAFRDKHRLTVPLISDEQHEMLEAYRVWGEKSLYGRTFLGIMRTTVLIGPDGRIIKVWRNVRVDGHAEAVLEEARAAWSAPHFDPFPEN